MVVTKPRETFPLRTTMEVQLFPRQRTPDSSTVTAHRTNIALAPHVQTTMVYTHMNKARHGHGALSPLISHKEIGTARTWRLNCTGALAGEDAYLSLYVGQVRSGKPHRLVIQVVPMQDRAIASPEEKLQRAIVLRDPFKGERRTLRFGPVCGAGAHLLSVTLDGAHVIGSPLQLYVVPALPHAPECEVRALNTTSARPSGRVVRECAGPAGKPILFAAVLRDQFGNPCTTAQAQAVIDAGELSAVVTRRETEPEGTPAAPLGCESGVSDGGLRLLYGVSGADGPGVVVVQLTAARAAICESRGTLKPALPRMPSPIHKAPIRAKSASSFCRCLGSPRHSRKSSNWGADKRCIARRGR